MITRKIGKLLRGKATPGQLMMACVLGSALGFVPGFGQGPGLTVAIVLLLVVLNANLFVAGLATLAGKALCLALLPVSFAVGRALLDGPAQGLFKIAVNAPVLAWFGFEHYATTGGLVLGVAIGVVMGLVVIRGLTAFRRRMARLEEGSPRYNELARRWWARALVWLLAGKGHSRKTTYDKLLERRVGNPIRPLGAVLAVLVIGLGLVLYQFASEPIVTAYLQRGLERANGATVDVGSAQLDLAQGRLAVRGFAMADPSDLATDLLRAAEIEADISATDLLRRRVAIDRLVLVDASTGERRAVPGRRIGPAPQPGSRDEAPTAEGKTLETYVEEAKQWKARLAQVRRWLERLSGPDESEADAAGTRDERLRRRRDEVGYARVEARHLIEGAPTLAVYELLADGVRTPYLPDETLAISGENLSTHPHLLDRPARLSVRSSGGTIDASARFEAPAGGANTIELHCRGLSGDAVGSRLAAGGAAPIRGGTVDIDAAGTWSRGAAAWIDVPLSVTLIDTTISMAGAPPTEVDKLVVPIGVRGPLDDPRISIDDRLLADALVKAGAGELARRVQTELGTKIPAAGESGDVGGALKKGLGDLLGGSKKK